MLLLFLLLAGQPAERDRVFEATRASVVALRCPDGHGSGLILDGRGLILTNAHVMVSPEAYTAEVEDGANRALFRSVKLVGVHPKLDLALVRIDPSEHRIALKPMAFAPEGPEIGAPVYAVGFPSGYGGHSKVITGGAVMDVNRYIDGFRYHEVSNEIWTGNSGGPLCDHKGRLVGVITLGMRDGLERWGAAIPADEYKPDAFVPLRDRVPNPSATHRYLEGAERLLKGAREGDLSAARFAETLFMMALMHDVGNADAYFKIGMIRRNTGRPDSAAVYISRALLLDPAPPGGARHYAELGIAFAQKRKKAEARAVWEEGIAKYPDACGLLWDALAVDHWEEGRYLEAALASRASLRAYGPRAGDMNRIYEECRKRFDAREKAELERREGEIDARLADYRKRGDAARKAGQAFVFPDCEKALRSVRGTQEGGNLPAARRPSAAADANAFSDDEVLRLFLDAQLTVAREHLRAGRLPEARALLEDVHKAGPQSPAGRDAKTLLDLMKK